MKHFNNKISILIVVLISISILIMACQKKEKSVELIKKQPTITKVEPDKLGIRTGSVSDEKDALNIGAKYFDPSPGGNTKIERSFENAPPLIPHTVNAFMITKDVNACAYCHTPSTSELFGSTEFPLTHLKELTGEKTQKDTLNPMFYNCLQCHVPQTNVKAPVANTFKPVFTKEESKTKSNLSIESNVIWGKNQE